MSEGEHTIIGRIPRERLNQIAGRKLSALGLAVRLGGDRETLEGELLRQPMGAPRKMATAVLAANFVPEEPAGP